MERKYRSLITLALAALVVVPLNGCRKEKKTVTVVQKPQVTVARAVPQTYIEHFDFPGHIEAVDSVTIKTRVAGFLKSRLFEEGDVVQKGQLLFKIEDEPFKARVAQAAADLAKAEADAKNAKLSLNRALELRKTGNISQATVDAREAENSMAQAQVLQAKATLNLTKIDLGYTDIRAPFTGKIGLADFSDGEFLAANTTLAQMVSCNPMHVLFSINEREMLTMQKAGVFGNGGDNLAITLKMADDSVYAYGGEIDFFDVTVNAGTDTLKMRATFPNPKQELVAGQYVTIVLEYEAPEEKLVIPQKALMSAAATKYVFVVNKEGKIENKTVVLGPEQGEDVVVLSGLDVNEQVVVGGIQKVRPGVEVVIQDARKANTANIAGSVEKKASSAKPLIPAEKRVPAAMPEKDAAQK